ncbi:hypothetical protein ACQEU6_08660 [Spirillospora sp. CA-108201]
MHFDVETPLRGYKGTVGAVTFVDGRARVTSDQRAELAYFRRHGYKITPVKESTGEPADAGDPGGNSGNPAAAGPGGTSEDQAEQPSPDGGTGQTAAEAAAERQGEPYKPADSGTGDGFDSSALTDTAATKAAETANPSGTDEDEPGELRKPAKNAPVAVWTAYAKQLGATDDELGGKTKNELVELVDQYENREVGR